MHMNVKSVHLKELNHMRRSFKDLLGHYIAVNTAENERRKKNDIKYSAIEQWNAQRPTFADDLSSGNYMRIVESLFNVASTYLPAVAAGAITSAATKNPAHFSKAMLGTMTFQEFNNLSADGLAYLVNDKPVSLEMFNSNVAKYKK